MSDLRDVVPAHLLITAHKNGGLLLGAYDVAKLVGFAFGFLGAEGQGSARRLKHCSHMLAVLPSYRSLGLGAELKKQQRDYLLAQGLELATWTYDPLQAINAMLNLNRLGAVARRYLRDAYGEMQDGLNAGVASDRFEVEWWLDSPRVRARIEQPRVYPSFSQAHPFYEVAFDKHDLPYVVRERGWEAETGLVEIPFDFNALKGRDPSLAQEWRARTRVTFETAFTTGYMASELTTWQDDQGHWRVAYVLQKLI